MGLEQGQHAVRLGVAMNGCTRGGIKFEFIAGVRPMGLKSVIHITDDRTDRFGRERTGIHPQLEDSVGQIGGLLNPRLCVFFVDQNQQPLQHCRLRGLRKQYLFGFVPLLEGRNDHVLRCRIPFNTGSQDAGEDAALVGEAGHVKIGLGHLVMVEKAIHQQLPPKRVEFLNLIR